MLKMQKINYLLSIICYRLIFDLVVWFRFTKLNNQINDNLTMKPNIIFATIVQKDPHRGIANACHKQ